MADFFDSSQNRNGGEQLDNNIFTYKVAPLFCITEDYHVEQASAPVSYSLRRFDSWCQLNRNSAFGRSCL